MNRKRKLILNTVTGVIKQLTVIVCGFILPRYILQYYGSEVNGLVSSISHFLNFITFLEMGVGAVVQSNLYRPLAQNDQIKVSLIVAASRRFFRRIAYIFIGYILVLLILYPLTLNREFSWFYSDSLLLVISFNLFCQYYFSITNVLLLNADQKAYVSLLLSTCVTLLNVICSVALMKQGAPVLTVKLISSLIFLIQPLFLEWYVRRNYPIDRTIVLQGEPIQQKWNGFSQHVAAVVCDNVDVVLLTLFATLRDISIYGVYYMVVNGVRQTFMTGAQGLESLFGNMLAKNEKEKLLRTFEGVEWITHTVVVILFTSLAVLIVPFMRVYTHGITDANYIQPIFGLLMTLAYASLCMRTPYFRMIKAAGHYRQTQNGAYISAGLNIVVSLLCVFRFGLIGVAIGTVVALIYHTCYFVLYLRRSILFRPVRVFFCYLMTDAMTAVSVYYICRLYTLNALTYGAWAVLALKVLFTVCGVTILINLLLYRKQMMQVAGLLFGKLKKRNGTDSKALDERKCAEGTDEK